MQSAEYVCEDCGFSIETKKVAVSIEVQHACVEEKEHYTMTQIPQDAIKNLYTPEVEDASL